MGRYLPGLDPKRLGPNLGFLHASEPWQWSRGDAAEVFTPSLVGIEEACWDINNLFHRSLVDILKGLFLSFEC